MMTYKENNDQIYFTKYILVGIAIFLILLILGYILVTPRSSRTCHATIRDHEFDF